MTKSCIAPEQSGVSLPGIFIALTMLLLGIVLTSPTLAADGAPTSRAKTTTLLILVDGFGARLLDPRRTPNLSQLGARGVASSMTPVWPSVSRPNHWALVTGLDARHSGVHHNDMYNPRTGRLIAVEDAEWGFGEPVWGTLAREGRISGVVGNWSGAKRKENGAPTFHVPFHHLPNDGRDRRAAAVLELLDQPPSTRAELLALYVPDVDVAEHEHGVDSREAEAALARVDKLIGELLAGLKARKLIETTNLVFVADHGHMNVVDAGFIVLSDHLDITMLAAPPVGAGPVVALWPKPGQEEAVHARLTGVHPRLKVYRGGELPPEFRCCRADRTPPILLVVEPGWWIETQTAQPKGPRGAHGYDPRIPEMQAVFVAAGPGVRAGARLQHFNTVDVYSFLAAILKIEAQPSDGSIQSFCGVLVDPPRDCLAAYRDDPTVERVATNRIVVTWLERGAVDVYVGTEPSASVESMRLVSDDDRDGRHELQLTDGRRPYVLLVSEQGGKRRVAERVIPLERGSNFRDVGGYPAANGRRVRWGVIYRSGAMPELTQADYRLLGQLGIRVLCDLRSTEERELAPMRWQDVPTARYTAIDYPASAIFRRAGTAHGNLYREWPTSLAPQFRAIFDALLAGEAPLAFNCSAGQDRTGVATALVLSALGVPRDTILADYHLSTTYRRSEFELGNLDFEKLAGDNIVARTYLEMSRRGPDAFKPKPLYDATGRARLAATFDEIESRWGSVQAYLEQVLAVDGRDVEQLQTMYLE